MISLLLGDCIATEAGVGATARAARHTKGQPKKVHKVLGMYLEICMDQKHARKGLEQTQAWHAGDVSVSPEHGEAYEPAGVTRAWRARPLSACIRK